MMGTSVSICLPAPIAGSGKSGFSALGVAAQEKLYAVEHVPSSPGWGALFSPLLPLLHAPAGIPPNCREMAHSATVHSGHHRTTGAPKTPQRWAAWATSACSSLRPIKSQSRNLMKPNRKVNYGPKDKQSTRENMSP